MYQTLPNTAERRSLNDTNNDSKTNKITTKYCFTTARSSHPGVFCRKGVLRNFAKFTGKHLCQSLFFNKKETLVQVFSCEFCEISKNTFSYRTPLVATS